MEKANNIKQNKMEKHRLTIKLISKCISLLPTILHQYIPKAQWITLH